VKRDVFELCSKLQLQNEVVRKLKCIADKTISHEIDMLIGHLVCPETAEQTYKILAEMFGEEKDNSRLLFCYLNAALITLTNTTHSNSASKHWQNDVLCAKQPTENALKSLRDDPPYSTSNS